MKGFSYVSNAHPEYIESLYNNFKENPTSVDTDWKKFFEGFDYAVDTAKMDISGEGISPKEFQVYALIEAYRRKGHLTAKTNPIRKRLNRRAKLELSNFGLSDADLKETFQAGEFLGLGPATLEKILGTLKTIYSENVGVEYMYIIEPEVRNWFQEKIEKGIGKINFALDKKKRILQKLNETVVFEQFLHTKYIGQKRFSLEGGETTIPALDAIINTSADMGVKEVVIGMAHRGRLNVLANILRKTYEQIFSEFEGNVDPESIMGDGDVKYHMGFSSEIKTFNKKDTYVKLMANPSHLEAVDPVVEGFVRAKADKLYNSDYDKVLPVLIHGDAAIAGQGVVYEVIQMSKLEGYYTGGTIHFIVNNQIGFTTDFQEGRSASYCTNVARVVNAPVIHVNGDDPEAVVFCAELAAEFRNKFNRDIILDMVCYRRHGHNEGDDPKYTQPQMYEIIGKHPNPREVYVQKLIESGSIEADLAKKMNKDFWQQLQDRLNFVKQKPLPYHIQETEKEWLNLRSSKPADFEKTYKTSVPKATVDKVIQGLIKLPEGFKPLRKVQRMLEQRRKAFFEDDIVDWASAELLAYGTLLLDGNDVRMSGQDVKRGTFSHRHAILYDEETNQQYNRLNQLAKDQGKFRIYNSLLSEYGVLGFEYGYSQASPYSLTIWEAQFGDFVNGSQIIIDQFITSSETKWQRMSGLVMLLPHGYEGQGPEHSSARLERFLQACAEFNMIVANITKPANFFHLLRRQIKFPFRKPLIVMSPKSLLRHPQCISNMEDITKGKFHELFDDEKNFTTAQAGKIKRVLWCSGKIYYDLLDYREKNNIKDTAIVRLEQLYPLPFKQMDAIVKKYSNAQSVWVQEEPANMGAWTYMLSCYQGVSFKLSARKASASPATGHAKRHAQEQQKIIETAFNYK